MLYKFKFNYNFNVEISNRKEATFDLISGTCLLSCFQLILVAFSAVAHYSPLLEHYQPHKVIHESYWFSCKSFIPHVSVGKYDVVIVGGGPGGYVAAIKASQLGLKVTFTFQIFYSVFSWPVFRLPALSPVELWVELASTLAASLLRLCFIHPTCMTMPSRTLLIMVWYSGT